MDPSGAIPCTATRAVPFPVETNSGAAIDPFTGLLTPIGGVALTIAESNADQVRKIREVLEGLSLEIATPAEARQMLALKGGDKVNF